MHLYKSVLWFEKSIIHYDLLRIFSVFLFDLNTGKAALHVSIQISYIRRVRVIPFCLIFSNEILMIFLTQFNDEAFQKSFMIKIFIIHIKSLFYSFNQ